MRIKTERLILRDWREEDIEAFVAISSDPVVMRFYSAIPSREKTVKWVQAMSAKLAAGSLGFLAAELKDNGRFVGFIGLNYPIFDLPIARIPEIGWRIARDLWGQGLAPEGAKACIEYGFETLKLPEIVAYTAGANLPSQRVMEKIGMKRDPTRDYDHPNIAEGHPFRRHLVWAAQKVASIGQAHAPP